MSKKKEKPKSTLVDSLGLAHLHLEDGQLFIRCVSFGTNHRNIKDLLEPSGLALDGQVRNVRLDEKRMTQECDVKQVRRKFRVRMYHATEVDVTIDQEDPSREKILYEAGMAPFKREVDVPEEIEEIPYDVIQSMGRERERDD